MIGIVSFGGYIPRLRLNRMAVYQGMGWFNPALVMVAQGERAFCGWDEDALTMAVAASRDCLKGQDKGRVDAHLLCSTTLPFQDRSNAGLAKTALNLRDDLSVMDVTGTLRAGTMGLLNALDTVRGGARERVLVTAADKRETKAATFYELWLGDGAASMLVGEGDDVVAELLGAHTVTHDFVDHFRGAGKAFDYTWEERWVRDAGYSTIIPEAVNGLFEKLSITMDDVDTFVFPCFFKAEHKKIARRLGATPDKVVDNLHEVCGETGAAHPLVMLSQALEGARPGDRILLVGFGQGADALYFRVTDRIAEMAARQGIRGALEAGETTDNYFKFLKFRGLLPTDMGIRAEVPTQTAMTVLWRERKMLTALVGGHCRECGTQQYPRMDVCVNPACNARDSQDEREFADQAASIKSFTGDLLAVSIDPPAVYGMVEFVEGGRFMADFTDCDMDHLAVGQAVEMVFRRKYQDDERGFSGYFWKARPLPLPEADEETIVDPIRFDGQVAVVTGAGAGLGRAYALELAKRGAKVVVNDLGGATDGTGASVSAADAVVDEIKAAGGEAVASYDSVATAEGGQAIVDTAVAAFGRLDVLINNAGILRDKSFARMTPDLWAPVLAVHLEGAAHVTRPAFTVMRGQGYGRIVMTTSAAGLFGNFGQSNYSAAKMGLIGLMNTLKIEGERHGIQVNTVAPLAATRLTRDLLPPEVQEKSRPEYVAPMVVYLCSKDCEASGQIFAAGMGFFGRAAVVAGPGAVPGAPGVVPTPEALERAWEDINRMDDASEYPDATSALAPMMSAFEPSAGR